MIELLIPFAILGGMDGVEPLRDSAPLREIKTRPHRHAKSILSHDLESLMANSPI